jgi:multiple sugar transport system substrate-binding protein
MAGTFVLVNMDLLWRKGMKKAWLFLSALLFVVSTGFPVFAGGARSSGGSSATAGKLNVQWWHYFTNTSPSGSYVSNLIREYNARPDGKLIVTDQYLPRNDLLRRYALGVVSNDLPELGMVDNPDSASFAAMGMWLDVTDLTAQLKNPRFLEGPLNSGKLNDKQYTLPLRSNCLGLWSNDEMIKKAGITKLPETWDELLDVCDKLQKTNPPNVYPLAFCAQKTEEGTFQFLPFLLSTGVTWDNMDSPEAAKALSFIKTLADKRYISPEVINWSQGDVQKQFAAGNISMMVNGSWQISSMLVDAPDLKYTISNIPRDKQFATSLGGENIGITKAAAGKREQVWDFVEYIESLEVGIPFNEALGTMSPNLDATTQYASDKIMQSFMEQIRYSVARGPHPKWSELSTAVQEAIQETLTNIKTPARAGADAAAKIRQINASVQ